jgi:hypothetical protein
MRRGTKILLLAPLGILAFAGFITVGGLVVRGLWNWLLPPLFGWPTLTFWQALGLLALCRILFGGLSLGGGSRGSRRRERGECLTAEERARVRAVAGASSAP